MVEEIQRERTVFPSTAGQGRLPSFNEGRGGRGNYQGEWKPNIPSEYFDEVTTFNTFSPTENYGPVGSGITSLGENYVPPNWWETQMGGKAYGPFHKSGSIYNAPQDYPGLMKLEPGQNYSHLDLSGNPMLNQSEWSEYSPYRRSNPLIQDLSRMAGSRVPDELLFEDIGDGNFKWNPWQSDDLINARHWLPEEYSINPGIEQFEDVFQFRDFPWMGDEGPSLGGRPTLPPEMYEDNRPFQVGDIQDDNEAVMKLYERGLSMEEIDLIMSDREMETTNLGNYDLFHLMQNGYSLEEAQEILDTQLG